MTSDRTLDRLFWERFIWGFPSAMFEFFIRSLSHQRSNDKTTADVLPL